MSATELIKADIVVIGAGSGGLSDCSRRRVVNTRGVAFDKIATVQVHGALRDW